MICVIFAATRKAAAISTPPTPDGRACSLNTDILYHFGPILAQGQASKGSVTKLAVSTFFGSKEKPQDSSKAAGVKLPSCLAVKKQKIENLENQETAAEEAAAWPS